MLHRKPQTWVITPGDPWTINGTPTEATQPREALLEIFQTAKKFPATIVVQTPQGDRHLLMDDHGRTTPIAAPAPEPEQPERSLDQMPGDTPAEKAAALHALRRGRQPKVGASPVTPVSDPASEEPEHQNVPKESDSAEPSPLQAPKTDDQDHTAATEPTPADDMKQAPSAKASKGRLKTKPVWIVIPAAALLLIGAGGTVLAGQNHQSKDEDQAQAEPVETSSSEADWALEGNQKPVAILGDRVITLEDKTIRVLEAATGQQIGQSHTTDAPDKVRTFNGDSASAVDDGAGTVLLIDGNKITEKQGTLNARGTSPVVVKDLTWTTADGQTGQTEKDQAVLDATTQGVVQAAAPNKITVDGKTTALKAPEDGAKISQWVRATETNAVMVWSKDGSDWLTIHDASTGEVQSKHKIQNSQVTLRNGIVWAGENQYLEGTELKDLCQGGEQITGVIMCPTSSGWESADHKIRASAKPEAVSTTHLIINGRVTTKE